MDVTHDMKIMTDETFGPIISIMKVSSEDEAIRLANDSFYGLNGNVWTKDITKGEKIAKSIETGACSINDMAMSYGVNEAPFGGVKNSGLGSVNGKEGLRSYAHQKKWNKKESTGEKEYFINNLQGFLEKI